MNNIDLKEKFQQYFHEQEGFGLRSERFYTDIESQVDSGDADIVLMKTWLEAAFIQGAITMTQHLQDVKK